MCWVSITNSLKASISALEKMSKEKLAEIKIVFGHMSFGLDCHFPSGCQYVTMLRHPISRIVSHFNFVKNNPCHYLHDKVMKGSGLIENYVEESQALELNNGMLRNFIGDSHRAIPFGQCKISDIEVVINKIDNNFVAIGIQEYFDESVDYFCEKIGWVKPIIEATNVGVPPAMMN